MFNGQEDITNRRFAWLDENVVAQVAANAEVKIGAEAPVVETAVPVKL